MPVLSKGTTYATNQQVTATNLNALVDNATFASGAVDNVTTQLSGGSIIVKDGGISAAKLASGIVDQSKLASPTGTGAPVCATSPTIATPTFTGTSTPQGLVDISGASAGQVKFPATQNASSDANTLDDYEEGTWTPSVGGTASYTTQTGRYTKIGRLVVVNGTLQINSIGTGSTYLISGLPFAPGIETAGSVSRWANSAQNVNFIGCFANTSSQVNIVTSTAADPNSSTTPAFLGNSTLVQFSVSYTV